MKIWRKKEMKKYPYKKTRPLFKTSIISQIQAREEAIRKGKSRWAIIDEDNKIVEKYRLRLAAGQNLAKLQKDHFQRLKIVALGTNGELVTPSKR